MAERRPVAHGRIAPADRHGVRWLTVSYRRGNGGTMTSAPYLHGTATERRRARQ